MDAATATGPSARRLPAGLLLAAGAYLLLRGLLLHTAFDEVGLWMYEVNPMGTLAEMCIRGIRVPPYLFYDNAAGQVLAGYLTVPAFLLFGPSYFALKIVPFSMGLGTLFLVHALLKDAFGRTAALLGAWLVVFAPTTFFKYSVVCSGNHFENVFFTSIVLFLFYRVHGGAIRPARLLGLGTAAGFAIFVFLGAVIPVGILALMHLGIRGPRRFLRDLAPLAAGFAAGLSPLLVLNAWTAGRGASFLAAKFGGEGAIGSSALVRVPGRIWSYLAEKLPLAADYPGFLGVRGSWLGWAFALALIVAFLAALPSAVGGVRGFLGASSGPSAASERARFEDARLVPMVLYLPLSALAFGLSNLVVYRLDGPLSFSAYRYFLPAFLFGILAIAAVCARGLERGGWRRVGAMALYAAALLPGASNLGLVDWSFSHTGLGFRYDGYDLSKIARALVSTKNRLSQAEIHAFLADFPPLLRARVTRALGFNLAVLQVIEEGGRGPDAIRTARVDLDPLLAAYAERDHAEIARGAGIAARFLQYSSGADLGDLLGLLGRTCEQASAAARPHLPAFLEGVATPNPILPLAGRTATILRESGVLAERALTAFPPEVAPRLANGLARGDGWLCGGLLRRGIPGDVLSVSGALETLPRELRSSFFRGLGAGCADGGEAPGLPRGFPIPDAEKEDFWAGFASRLASVHGPGAEAAISAVQSGWSPAERAEFARAWVER